MKNKRFIPVILLTLVVALLFGVASFAQDDAPVFYWISHGSEADPIWVLSYQGAQLAAEDFNVDVRGSFHSNDVASQKEAFQAAIAAGADGIVSSNPDPNTLNEEVASAQEAGIPVVFINTDDPSTGRDAFIGSNQVEVGRVWAQYLVDNGFVESGDRVWLPVEVPGATYQVDETRGIASVFDPLGVEYEVFDAGYEQSNAIANMTDYLVANAGEIDAIIGLGDLVTGSMQRVFEGAGLEPGSIPVVGWGNSLDTALAVQAGYVNAGYWQYPNTQSYLGISLLNLSTHGVPPSFDIITGALYDASDVELYIEQLEASLEQ